MIWRHIRDFAAAQVGQRAGAALRCPGCKRWTYEYDGWSFTWGEGEPVGRLTCEPCSAVSRWLDAPALILLNWARPAPGASSPTPQEASPPAESGASGTDGPGPLHVHQPSAEGAVSPVQGSDPPTWHSDGWRHIIQADFVKLFAASEWVLVATDEPRITIAKPLITGEQRLWVAGTGPNLSDPRWPCEFLPFQVLAWQKLPHHPAESGASGTDGQGPLSVARSAPDEPHAHQPSAEGAVSPEADGPTFTLVFRGDLTRFKGNPFHAVTPFGTPFSAGIGNAFEEIDRLNEQLTEAEPPPNPVSHEGEA